MNTAMTQFCTRPQANAGVHVQLKSPITGQDTEHWLLVRGQDSDEFRAEEDAARRRIQDAMAALPSDQRNVAKYVELTKAAKAEDKLLGAASLVAAWSFADVPCTRENVVEWLRDAPQVQDQIDMVAGDRALFLASAAPPSTDSPK